MNPAPPWSQLSPWPMLPLSHLPLSLHLSTPLPLPLSSSPASVLLLSSAQLPSTSPLLQTPRPPSAPSQPPPLTLLPSALPQSPGVHLTKVVDMSTFLAACRLIYQMRNKYYRIHSGFTHPSRVLRG